MKHTIPALLLSLLLLCGCAPAKQTEETAAPATPTEAQTAAPVGYYDPDSVLERATNGALRCYPLTGMNVSGVMPLGDDLLLFSNTETGTDLTVLEGTEGYAVASAHLDFCLLAQDESLNRWDGGISFFDAQSGETVVLDSRLREVSRISVPSDLVGIPVLSEDRGTLYYCTQTAIRALDLETGISRCLKEIACSYQSVAGLWLNDTVLQCHVADGDNFQTLFVSTETGAILGATLDSLTFTASDDRYYASFPNGAVTSCVFGESGEVKALNAEGLCYFLSEEHAAAAVRQPDEKQTVIDYYDLDSGQRTAMLTLETDYLPWNFETLSDGQVVFLNYDEAYGCETLYRWDTTATPTGDAAVYTGIHYTREKPDYDGLAACKLYAEEIGSKYGIEVSIYKDAAATEPWDYDLEYEYLATVTKRELELLDEHLAHYPEGFLKTLSGYFDGIRICIVRSITGTVESGSLDTANGVQFMDGYTACIALAAPENTEYALYHELCHLIDTAVITESGAYDRWDQLNPKGFAYDYDYIVNRNRSNDEYLQESNRSFIDAYAMSFPKEDRARIMEYAMTPGNEAYFVSLTMQSKLKLLCEGIREAFGLKKSPETFLWEQYLNTSLAYTG